MKRNLLVFLYLFCVFSLYSQTHESGLPGIRNFLPREYKQESQNFSIVQDSNSLIYVGNANGIMEFDNTTWRLIRTTGTPMLSFNKKDNRVYYGGYNQFGYIEYKQGVPYARDINLHSEYKPGQINKIIANGDKVFFTSSHQLFVYQNDSVELEVSNSEGINIFLFNKTILVYIPNRGLYEWGKEKLELFNKSSLFQNIDIADLIELSPRSFLIKKSNDLGFLKFSHDSLFSFTTEIDDFLLSNDYSKGVVLDNNRYVFGSIHGGLVCIDSLGHFLFSLNRDYGLRSNHITDLYVSNDGHLWVATYNGISLVETKSGISFFDQSFGFSGTILSIARFQSVLYVGTANGVFRCVEGNIYNSELNEFNYRKRFEKVDEIRSRCWELKVIKNHLYAVTTDGIYEIINHKPQLLLSGSFNTLTPINFHKNMFLAGSTTGLLMCQIIDSKLDTIGYLNNFKYSIRTIAEDYYGNFWLGTNEDGLFRTNFASGFNLDNHVIHYSSRDGLPHNYNWVDVFQSFHGVLFSTNKGVYNYNIAKDRFEADSLLVFDFNSGKYSLYPLVEDRNKNIWYSCLQTGFYEREIGVLLFNGANNRYTSYTKSLNQLNEYIIESIYPENDNLIWFGTSDALIKYNISNYEERKSSKFNCLLRSVVINRDSTIYLVPENQNFSEEFTINFTDKTIKFNFTGLSYNAFGEILYQVKLENFDDNWSEWSKDNYKEYTSLREGEYIFKVKAKDVFGNISKEQVFKFRVNPPFYRTWYAYTIYFLCVVTILFLLAVILDIRHKTIRVNLEKLVEARTNELVLQKEQTEQLVKQLLPQNTANEIRETGKAKSQKYELVSVLFADIQGFTQIAETTSPEDLIKQLNKIFTNFDKIIAQYNIEKIKTIGDAYMCAGGMPNRDNTNPVEVVLAALEMQRAIKQMNENQELKLEIRIGIHTGPVVAGVVGVKKIEYDIWGDTVNTASRMESHGVVGKVNVSEYTYDFIKDFFSCQYRGKITVKYKGEMEMYFVNDVKKTLSQNADKITPNNKFKLKLQYLQIKEIQENILDQLQKNLPANLYYHNVKHTINVIYIVEDIGNKEGVDEEDMLLLKCAALFHDAGFMVSYDNNEEIGAKMAEQTLNKYKFSNQQIEIVKRIIMATKMPQRPKDILEMIICDADLDYLGRPDFIPISQNLFRELFERGKISSIEQWNKMQYKFVTSHTYFTATGRKNRDIGKKMVIKQLQELV